MDRPRVLLADDHQGILDRVSHQLAGEFEIVAMVSDGQAALDAALALKPAAVVLDISMPRLNGLDAARLMSDLPNPPQIVFLTVHEESDFIDAAERAGAAGYVFKRHMCSHLIAVLRRALAGQGAIPRPAAPPVPTLDH